MHPPPGRPETDCRPDHQQRSREENPGRKSPIEPATEEKEDQRRQNDRPAPEPAAGPEPNPHRSSLDLGGFGPVAAPNRRALQRDRHPCLTLPCQMGPTVRIRFPPAESQVRTCLSRDSPSYVEKPRFFAGVRAGASGAVGRDAQDAATSGPRAVISLSGHIPVPHRR